MPNKFPAKKWSKEPQWENDCGSFLPCFLLVMELHCHHNSLIYVKKIIKKINGLPLSLKVMGAFLRGKERIRSWERALQRMNRGRHLDGDEGLWSTLKINFDGLGNHEKNMFLDLACFLPMRMSKEKDLCTCTNDGGSPNHVLDILVDKSLVKINQDGNVEMHDQLRDMGCMIVETDKQYLGTRIWNLNMIPLRIGSAHEKVWCK